LCDQAGHYFGARRQNSSLQPWVTNPSAPYRPTRGVARDRKPACSYQKSSADCSIGLHLAARHRR
jgi:hypothetical protein